MKERREEEIEETAVTPSGGNVFADLGLPDAEELLAKSTIAMKINQIIEKRHLSQTEAAALLGITQPKVSMIQHGKLRGFSLEKLCNLLTLLGRDVDIVIRERKKGGLGHMRVVSA
ncbi:helix-turn-helix domain-containing protein [Geomonas oryzae]|uniref:helix-turn-helix domain-containing protein n=1 Tax=Geomonas oryzae TaxID=2364273 RepID=UPI00100B012B|nr:helix-turn-helix transcriptional regulator [Geomonas oryzae]